MAETKNRKAYLFYFSLIWGTIIFGIFLRLHQFLYNRSLWIDEISIALNAANKPFGMFFHNQISPLGFLAIEKALIHIFGNNEYVLRAFPLFCGIISILLFYKFAKYYLSRNAVLISLGLFALSDGLIYYSSEAKQYSSDVFIALLLYLLTICVERNNFSSLSLILFAVTGFFAALISFPAIFVLAGIEAVFLVLLWKRREWHKIFNCAMSCAILSIGFAGYYYFALDYLSTNERLHRIWAEAFPPVSVFGLIDWLNSDAFRSFFTVSGLFSWYFSILFFSTGCIMMFRKNKKLLFYLIAPLLFTLLASVLRKYPFCDRLLLFTLPSTILIMAAGILKIGSAVFNKAKIAGCLLIFAVFLTPFQTAIGHIRNPRVMEEIKPVLQYISLHRQEHDTIYIYYGASKAFTYYSRRYNLTSADYIIGLDSKKDRKEYKEELDKLKGKKRVWIIFSNVYDLVKEEGSEKTFFLNYLDKIGMRLDSIVMTGSSAYLYNLGNVPNRK